MLDYECEYSSRDRLEIVQILLIIKQTGVCDKKKLQRLLNHYAIEHDNMVVVKP